MSSRLTRKGEKVKNLVINRNFKHEPHKHTVSTFEGYVKNITDSILQKHSR